MYVCMYTTVTVTNFVVTWLVAGNMVLTIIIRGY